jgi:LPXTG-motif cell wall-anchored protein
MHVPARRTVTLSAMNASSPSLQRFAAVLAAFLIALGGTAVVASTASAQSAGDEQYTDPLGDGGSPGDGGDEPTSDDGSQGDAAPPPPTPSAPAEPATPVAGETAPTLPRTGADRALLAELGLAMLLGGALLRRRARSI